MELVVQPARASWDAGYFLEASLNNGARGLGYEVMAHQELSNPDFYRAVALGEVHLWANGWFPLHNEHAAVVFEEGASLAVTVVSFGVLQGYPVDRAGAEELDITPLDGFKREEVKEAYGGFLAEGNTVECSPCVNTLVRRGRWYS